MDTKNDAARKNHARSDTLLIPAALAEDGYCAELEGLDMRNRAWTPQDVATIKRYYGKAPVAKIAAALDRTVNAVHKKALSIR